MKQQNNQVQPTPKEAIKEQKPFLILNMPFATKRTFLEFLITSLLIVIVPVVSVVWLNNWVKDDPNLSQLMKVIIAVGPAVTFINILMCTYLIRAIKDPQNYKVDPPLKVNIPKLKRN